MKSPNSKSGMNRRELLKTAASAAGAVTLGRVAHAADEPKEPKKFIEGYAGELSFAAGDRVPLHISTNASKFDVEILRAGAKSASVFKKTGIAGAPQETPDDASSHGCRWPVSLKVPVDAAWPSGYYRVLLHTQEENGKRAKGEAFFCVRSAKPGTNGRILLQLATNTYNAYNRWGGGSLYGGSKGITRRVSFERPYGGFEPTERFARYYSGWMKWEEPFVQWAEAAGYAIDFCTNADLEFRPEILKNYRLVLSVGHDEYWSAPMRDSLEAFIAKGGNAAFFSGNTCFWQVRSEDNGKALTSWKADFDKDPVYQQADKRLLSGMWSNVLVGRPENTLTGVSFTYGGYHKFFEFGGDGCYTVHQPEHWIFAGTGLKQGDKLGQKDQIVGYECDGCQMTDLKSGRPVPTHKDGTPESFQILGSAPAGLSTKKDNSLLWASEALYGKGTKKRHEQMGAAVLGCYTQGGTVFTTGCTEWARGLAGHDPAVERITRNVLDRLTQKG